VGTRAACGARKRREWRGRRLRHQRASRALSRRSVSATLTLADITEAGTQHSAKERGSLAPPVAPEQPPYGRGRLNVRYASAPQSEKGRSATVNDYRSRSDSTVADRPRAAVSRVRRLRSLGGAVDPNWRSTTSQACRTTGGHEAPSARRSRRTSGWHARNPIFGALHTLTQA